MKLKATVGLVLALLLAMVPASSLSSAKDAQASKDGVKTIVLSADNLITLDTEVSGDSAAKVISEAKALDAKHSGLKEIVTAKKPLYLFLNTPGGSIQSGLEMVEAIRGLGRPVHTITLFAASMGWQIAQNLDTRYIIKNGVLMSHRAKGGFEGEFGGKQPSQIESRYALWKSRIDEMDQQTVARTKGKQTLQSYQEQYASEMWLTGTQSVERGYADEVILVKCDSTLLGTTSHKAMIFGMIPVTYELDKCPINTSPLNIQVGIFTNTGKVMSEKEFTDAGGVFGPDCLVQSATQPGKVCALDTSLNMNKLRELAAQFKTSYLSKQKTNLGYTE